MNGPPLETPKSSNSVEEWSRQHKVPLHEARIRFVEFVILHCIATNKTLSHGLVFKGGNALRFVYTSVRSTTDLDFSVESNEISDNADDLRSILNRALRWSYQRYNLKTKCQRVKRNPIAPAATRPTYSVTIGFRFEGDRHFVDFDAPDRIAPTIIDVEITFNDLVCEDQPFVPDENDGQQMRVCTLEDIVAEKLRALLQQPIRNRNRCQDVFDIARIFRDRETELDFSKISTFFRQKCEHRQIEPVAASFDDEIRALAEVDYYRRMLQQAPNDFIPFVDGWKAVKSVVSRLEL